MVMKTRLGLLRHGVVAQFIIDIPWNMGHAALYLPTQGKALQKHSLVLGLGHLLCCNTDTTKAAQPCTWAFAFAPMSQLWLALNQLPWHCLTQMFSVKQHSSCLSHVWIYIFMNSFPFLPQSHGKHKSINALVVLSHCTDRLHEPAAVAPEQPSIHSWTQMCLACWE